MDFSRNFIDENRETVLDIVLALLFIMIAGAYFFGYRAIMVTLMFVIFTVLFENAISYAVKREFKTDMKTVMYAVLCAFLCPVSVPVWAVAFGGVVLSSVKFLFETKKNFCFTNPAVLTVALMNVVFLKSMSKFTMPFAKLELWSAYATSEKAPPENFLYMFLGDRCGFLGTTSVAVILICAVFLILRGKLRWDIPLICISVCILTGLLFHGRFVEGMVFSAVFLSTDFDGDKRGFKEASVYSVTACIFAVFYYYGLHFYGSSVFAFLTADLIFFCLRKFKEKRIFSDVAK